MSPNEQPMNASPVRNVVFDFGGVLVRWKPTEILESFYEDERLRRLAHDEVFNHSDWVELDRGTLSDEAAIPRFAAGTVRAILRLRWRRATCSRGKVEKG